MSTAKYCKKMNENYLLFSTTSFIVRYYDRDTHVEQKVSPYLTSVSSFCSADNFFFRLGLLSGNDLTEKEEKHKLKKKLVIK